MRFALNGAVGPFTNGVVASAGSPLGASTSDVSDDGIDPDPDGNGDPGGPAESDPTPIGIALGSALEMTTTTTGLPARITLVYTFENFGSGMIDNLSATNDLTAVFGIQGVDWTLFSVAAQRPADPAINQLGSENRVWGAEFREREDLKTNVSKATPPDFANPDFDGFLDFELINQAPMQSLAAGNAGQVVVVIDLLTLDAVIAGQLCNQVTASGTMGGTAFSDSSADGQDPDPSDDGIPDESASSCISAGVVPVTLMSFEVN